MLLNAEVQARDRIPSMMGVSMLVNAGVSALAAGLGPSTPSAFQGRRM